ncbi:L-threonine O-3-phosphate decarboxylase [Salinihabitans flavidus]|uniref:Aminotransferase n=1 Tax=Salinihabitans flavidus TaxID=569882 RepID=A0A1H8UXI4_9RHOB|nr:threonine-phosphate decarboxylase [Salinihabitans flavidus]SEP07861.1 L-threonine O-3-phosphate decarboxylase [Salinihabitans flavidus]
MSGRDHGGGVDLAAARWGGARTDWLDLSTGINPVPYPVAELDRAAWTDLPDRDAQAALIAAARRFWKVPDGAEVLAAPGASALIARIPALVHPGRVEIPTPTYNEHAAAFAAQGWQVGDSPGEARVIVHPNNPTGQFWTDADVTAPLCVIDESFCDIAPERSLVTHAARPGRIVLKSFGKFWGLAGLRLGFAIAAPDLIGRLAAMLGPWPVSGPALAAGATALNDPGWAEDTRARLTRDAARLDALMKACGAVVAGGTPLFRLYEVDDAARWQEHLARARVWSRVFPYSPHLIRLGLPAPDRWPQLEDAL